MPDASGDYDCQNDVYTEDPAHVRTPSAASADRLKSGEHRSCDRTGNRKRGHGLCQKEPLASMPIAYGSYQKEERLAGRQ